MKSDPVSAKQTVNVLSLLEFFATHQQPASMAEIARELNWPRSSTFNLLAALTARGYLYEPVGRGRHYPSPLWGQLARQIESGDPIPQQLQDLLYILQQRTGETAALAAISGAHAVYVDAVESPHAIRYTAKPGKMVPLHATATGRSLLAQMSPAERGRILRRAQFVRRTPTTLMSVEAVEAEIERSVRRGWFEGDAEYTPELGGVALPLNTVQRQYALLVAGPMFRLRGRLDEIARIVKEEVSRHVPAYAVALPSLMPSA